MGISAAYIRELTVFSLLEEFRARLIRAVSRRSLAVKTTLFNIIILNNDEGA
jgi:hypothetical protein